MDKHEPNFIIFVIEELIKIDKLKEAVQEDKRKHILEGDFY